MRRRTPLIYLYGISAGKYVAAWPVFILTDDVQQLTFSVEVDDANIVFAHGIQEEGGYWIREDEGASRRAYLTAQVRVRLHQRSFRERVLAAYREQCAFCRLRHQELLDAAHIIPDSDPMGEPSVSNGLALCKLHHAAFDSHFIGLRPDYILEVRRDILEEPDGPLHLYGLKAMQGHRIILPHDTRDWPDPALLHLRHEEFSTVR
jgi:putative restriction endonuclease